MITLASWLRIYLACRLTGMRGGMTGLAMLVQQGLAADLLHDNEGENRISSSRGGREMLGIALPECSSCIIVLLLSSHQDPRLTSRVDPWPFAL